MSHSQFLTLDSSKKPVVRKGVNYQSYVPPVLPGSSRPVSRAPELRKIQVALDARVASTLEKVGRTLPEMGPFNTIAAELASEYLCSSSSLLGEGICEDSKTASYWDEIEASLEKIVKQEIGEEGMNNRSSTLSLDSLRSLLSRLEAWNHRAITATLGTGQVLSREVDALLEEARLISVHVELPGETLTKLRILQKAGESFADQVRGKLNLKGKDKVALSVLTDLMREAEALPIDTEEVRFFRNQRGRIQAICHSAQKATKDKSLEKSRDVTVEAAEVRAVLPDLNFLKDQVSIGEWVQKAISKVDKRGTVPLQTIESLFEDPSAALIKPEECKVMADLKSAMNEAKAWQAKTNKILAGVPQGSKNGPRTMPSLEQLQQLQEEHANLPKICVPALSSNIEGIVRRAKAWLKKQERTLSGTWGLADAKNLLDEGRLFSQQVNLHPELGQLESEVAKAEDWCLNARHLIASLALTEIDQIEPLVTASFKAPDDSPEPDVVMTSASPDVPTAKIPSAKRALDEPGYSIRLNLKGKELQAFKNYESSLTELTKSLVTVEAYVVPLLAVGKLPTQDQLEGLFGTLGIVRDAILEDDITQLYEGAQKWTEKANSVLSIAFPRPAAVLRSLSQIIHELASCPMRYRDWDKIVQIAKEEVWAHEVRFATLPVGADLLKNLIAVCPFAPVSGVSTHSEENLVPLVYQCQNAWMSQVLGLESRSSESPSEMTILGQIQANFAVYESQCSDLLKIRRSPMHVRVEAEFFLEKVRNSQLLHMPEFTQRLESALKTNTLLEEASRALADRMLADFNGSQVGTHLFRDLLELLESVELAELLVEHFDQHFIPIVGKLLQYQSKVRDLFKWDHDEQVLEPAFRPSVESVSQLWNAQIVAESGLSLNFLTDVAYLASAHRALTDATIWQEALSELLSEPLVSLQLLRKHMAVWPQLAIEVVIEAVEEFSEAEEWCNDIASTLTSRSRHKVRASVVEATEVLSRVPNSLCRKSQEFASLKEQVATASELYETGLTVIKQSFSERMALVPGEVDQPVSSELLLVEIGRILRECRRLPIAVGIEEALEKETQTVSINKTVQRVLARPSVVPLDLVQAFLIAANDGTEFEGVSFGITSALLCELESKFQSTKEWKVCALEFVQTFSTDLPSVAVPAGGLVGLETALNGALNAPPTAGGEKILDMMLRNLDREEVQETIDGVVEYSFPLPLYQVPAADGKVGGSSKSGRSSKSALAAMETNPLLRKGLTCMQMLLFQVPWTRASQGYLSPLNDILMQKPREWLESEKEALTARIRKPGPILWTALYLLLLHKRANLFQTSEYVRLRSLAATALRAVKACVARFPFLQPRAENLDVPTEVWEKFVIKQADEELIVAEGAAVPEEIDLVTHLLALDALVLQVPTKYRLLLQMLDLYDWRVRAQSVCHHMSKDARPRPWAGDQRSLIWWNQAPQPHNIFMAVAVPGGVPGDPLCLHVAPSQPPAEFIVCAMHMSFYYVVESIRHFIRVMSDMCELCFAVSNTDREGPFWITCDACDKWFHGACAGLTLEAANFTCPNCVLASTTASPERKRAAQALLQSLPPRKLSPVSRTLRIQEAETLLNEAKLLPVVQNLNLQEISMFKRFLPQRNDAPSNE